MVTASYAAATSAAAAQNGGRIAHFPALLS
jgi:hypothetical protein